MALKFAAKKSLSSQLSKSSAKTSPAPTKAEPPKPSPAKPSIASKGVPLKSKGISPPTKPSMPKPSVGPLRTTLQRPCLRAFECLVNIEQAMKSIQGAGVFVGDDAEKQRALHEQITQDLIQLHLSYKTYWKQVAISTGEKE